MPLRADWSSVDPVRARITVTVDYNILDYIFIDQYQISFSLLRTKRLRTLSYQNTGNARPIPVLLYLSDANMAYPR